MKCDVCKVEDPWLEIVGSQFVCKKCLFKHKEMALIYRTHIDTFHFLLRKLKPENYDQYLAISRQSIEDTADLKKIGVKFKTTNVVKLE